MTTHPSWARRIRHERNLRGWTQRDCIRRLRYETPRELPDDEMMLVSWKRWESGRIRPDAEYQRLIAAMFGTVSGAMFATTRPPEEIMTAATGNAENTPDLLARMRASSIDTATLEALRVTVDRLCADYPSVPAHQLLTESRAWLDRLADLLNHRLTLSQHREVLSMAGMLALLVGCLEQDTGASTRAEATRRSALSLGTESDDHDVIGWSYEMSAWFNLTREDYRGVLTAADTGIEAGRDRGVSVQLFAQEAKAWARIGDRRRVEVALDRGRRILETLPYPDDVQHHFVVDPHKYDFYAMDTYRLVHEDTRADSLADEVLSMSKDWTGRVVSPMRAAEAHVTKGVVAARQGDLDAAISHGQIALDGTRQSVPSLVMVGKELGSELMQNYPNEAEANEYVNELRTLATTAA